MCQHTPQKPSSPVVRLLLDAVDAMPSEIVAVHEAKRYPNHLDGEVDGLKTAESPSSMTMNQQLLLQLSLDSIVWVRAEPPPATADDYDYSRTAFTQFSASNYCHNGF